MTLLETIEAEIEALGGYRATYHIIKCENSKLNITQRKAYNYFRNKRRENKLWKPSEIRVLRDNINKHVPFLHQLLPNRTYHAIRYRKCIERKNI